MSLAAVRSKNPIKSARKRVASWLFSVCALSKDYEELLRSVATTSQQQMNVKIVTIMTRATSGRSHCSPLLTTPFEYNICGYVSVRLVGGQ